MPNLGRLERGERCVALVPDVAARACGTVLTVFGGQASSGSSQKLLDAHHHAPIAMHPTHSPPGQWSVIDLRGLTADLGQASPKPYIISLD